MKSERVSITLARAAPRRERQRLATLGRSQARDNRMLWATREAEALSDQLKNLEGR